MHFLGKEEYIAPIRFFLHIDYLAMVSSRTLSTQHTYVIRNRFLDILCIFYYV